MHLTSIKLASYVTFYLFFFSVIRDWARGEDSTLSHLFACHVSPITLALMSASIVFHAIIRLLWSFYLNSTLLFFFLTLEVFCLSFCTACDTHHVPEIPCHFASCISGNVFSALFVVVSFGHTKNIEPYARGWFLYTIVVLYVLSIFGMWGTVVFVAGVAGGAAELLFLGFTVTLDAWGLHIMLNDEFSTVSSFLLK
jgi:hypothetical protein